MFQNISKYSC